ncbi:MAG: SyrP protein [Hellea sp.]|nr:SyrP protein [Hellea sp.]
MSDFPYIVNSNGAALNDLIARDKGIITTQVETIGAVLFRDFNVDTAEKLDAVVESYGEPGFTYEKSLSNAVRINLTPRVFTANEAPPDVSIFLHHEMAQTPLYPSKLFFGCLHAPEIGGATPICRSDWVLDRLKLEQPELVQALRAKGVTYTNIMPSEPDPQSGQGRSWKDTFGVARKKQVEATLAEMGYKWQWQEDDSLLVQTPRLDAIRGLGNGEESFFNQLIAAFRGWKDTRNDPSKSVRYGDGSAIDVAALTRAIEIADELTYDQNWQTGDVVLIDNFRVMHGRRPYTGKRKIVASLIA